jgi:hypothetical protein
LFPRSSFAPRRAVVLSRARRTVKIPPRSLALTGALAGAYPAAVTPTEPESAAELQRAMDALRGRAAGAPSIEVVATVRADEPGAVVAEVSVYLGRKYAGLLQLTRPDMDGADPAWPWPWRRRGEDDEQRRCREGVEALRRRHADEGAPLGLLVVSNVRVEPWARNAGAGLALYEEAASIARRRFGSMIVAHRCFGGQTSGDADRVWESDRFRAAADVYGRAAYGR